MLKTIVPEGTAHVGCVVTETDGTAGAIGTSLIVIVDASVVMQELSAMLRTVNVFIPAESPENEVPAW